MNTFSLHGANLRRNDAFPEPKSRGTSRQKSDGPRNAGEAVAVIISHPSYGSNEHQMLKKLMSKYVLPAGSYSSLGPVLVVTDRRGKTFFSPTE